MLALLCNAYSEEMIPNAKGDLEKRVVMKFHPRVAPIKVGVFPLQKNKPELVAKANEIYNQLKGRFAAVYDETGSIGKRYARQDEAGTPYCVTVDFDSVGAGEDPALSDTVTLRDRDTTEQKRVSIDELAGLIDERLRSE